ncbi:sulfotransferase domain-containing protein [Haloglycomyces albus]|uniref:sulfotransferase domain-containing protein n=1 Tax=Haloglycomyces albus TaxID=526067 RepID=UPI00046D824E|nr:sulfotransferase domain-containing protein [Haloglycomyces albus]
MTKTLRDRIPAPIRTAVSNSARTYGRLTVSGRLLPGFLICGGQRCGTTSLYRALQQHPAILKPNLHKGVHYFDTSYHKGLSWYRAHFATRGTARRIQDQTGLVPMAYESSPYYLYHPLARERFARDLPGIKVIVLVRDPVERAWSQHAHEVARGFEDITDFEAALAAEPERLAGEDARLAADPSYYSFSHQHHAYRARGQYSQYLTKLAELIGEERILVLDSGQFFTRPEESFERVMRFLSLPWIGCVDFRKHNGRGRPSPMSPQLRHQLTEFYEPFDAELGKWLGHTPSWRI